MRSPIISLAGFAYAAAQFIQFLWISRAYGANELGLFSLVIGVYAPLVSFLSAGQRFALLTQTDHNDNDVRTHSQIRLVVLSIITACLLIIAGTTETRASSLPAIILILGVYRLADSQLEIKMLASQRNKRAAGYIRFATYRVIPIPLACIFGYIFQLGLVSYLSLCTLFAMSPLIREWIRALRPTSIRHLGSNAHNLTPSLINILPVGTASGIESAAVIMPRYFLAQFGTLETVAAYTLLTQFSIAFGIVASAILQSDLPHYAKLKKHENKQVPRRVYTSILNLLLFITVFGIMLNLIPATVMKQVIGDWFLAYSNILFVIPAIAFVWYAGGYVANVLGVFSGRRWVLITAVALITLVGAGLLASRVYFSFDPLALALIVLSAAFSFRLFGGLALLHYRTTQPCSRLSIRH